MNTQFRQRTIKQVFEKQKDMNPQQFYSVVSMADAHEYLKEVMVNMQEFKPSWDISIVALALLIAKKQTLEQIVAIIEDCNRNNIKLITDEDVLKRIGRISPLEKSEWERVFRS